MIRRTRSAAVACLAALVCVVAAGCDINTPVRTRAVEMINGSRGEQGRGALTQNSYLDGRADATAARMRDAWVAAGCPSPSSFLSHTPDMQAHFRPEVVNPNWVKLGENVGYTGLRNSDRIAGIETLHRAYMDSPKHRDNIVDAGYRWLGIGVATGPSAEDHAAGRCTDKPVDSVMWNAQVFVK